MKRNLEIKIEVIDIETQEVAREYITLESDLTATDLANCLKEGAKNE